MEELNFQHLSREELESLLRSFIEYFLELNSNNSGSHFDNYNLALSSNDLRYHESLIQSHYEYITPSLDERLLVDQIFNNLIPYNYEVDVLALNLLHQLRFALRELGMERVLTVRTLNPNEADYYSVLNEINITNFDLQKRIILQCVIDEFNLFKEFIVENGLQFFNRILQMCEHLVRGFAENIFELHECLRLTTTPKVNYIRLLFMTFKFIRYATITYQLMKHSIRARLRGMPITLIKSRRVGS